MGDTDYRQNGGIGFAIDEPSIVVGFCASDTFSVSDHRDNAISASERDRLNACVAIAASEFGLTKSMSATIIGTAGAHSGFGTGTAIRLACLEGLFVANDVDVSHETLRRLSRRGGTSGIGIHTYFNGGYVFDLGRPNSKARLVPSSLEYVESAPLMLAQIPMPSWPLGLCQPLNIQTLSEDEEVAFFAETCPIPNEEIYRATYHTLFGLHAAILEGDKRSFCRAVNYLQSCAWKRAERSIYGEKLAVIEETLVRAGAEAVGMSSLGPTLYFFSDDVASVIRNATPILDGCRFTLTQPSNTGRVIEFTNA